MGILDIFRANKYNEIKSANIALKSELLEIKNTINSKILSENKKALSDHYGIDPKKMPQYKPTFAQKLFYNSVNLSYSFNRIIRDYDDMMADPLCGGAIELMTDDACQPSHINNSIYWPEANNKSNTNKLRELFESLNINRKIWEWTFRTSLYGEKLFKLKYKDPDKFTGGIVSINDDIELMLHVQPLEIAGQLIGYLKEGELYNPWEYIVQKMSSIPTVMRSVKANRVNNFTLFQDNKKEEHKNTYIPGTSVLESARRHWRMLRLMEDSLIIARLERAPVRRVYFVDSGKEDPKDSMELMHLYQQLIQDNTSFSFGTGLDVDFDRINYGSDIFIPVKNGTNSISSNDYTQAVDMGRIIDIKYFKDKLFAALKVPQAYLGFDESRSGGQIGQSALLRQDIRYARTVKKIKYSVVNFLRELCIIHLLSLGESVSITDIAIHSTDISTAETEERNSALEKAARVVQTIWQTYDRAAFENKDEKIDKKYLLSYLTENILQLPDFDVDKFFYSGTNDTQKEQTLKILPKHLKEFKNLIENNKGLSYKIEKYTPLDSFTLDELYVLITEKSPHNFDLSFNNYGFYILKDKSSISQNQHFTESQLSEDAFIDYINNKKFCILSKDADVEFIELQNAYKNYSDKETIVIYEDDTDEVLFKDRRSVINFFIRLLKYSYGNSNRRKREIKP